MARGIAVYQRRLQKHHKKSICLRISRVMFGCKDKEAIVPTNFKPTKQVTMPVLGGSVWDLWAVK